jgi:microcystin-dependent protein
MKKVFLLFVSLFILFQASFSQDSKGFSFQGIARDAAGSIFAGQTVSTTITLKNGNTDVYQEEHSVTTDDYGVFSLIIGQGTVITGNNLASSFSDVDFTNSLNVKIDVSINNGPQNTLVNYALQSVPYAKHASSATRAFNGVPPGAIMAYGGTIVPEGWLICDGRILDGNDQNYSSLYNAIGQNWGNAGDASSRNFNIPDLRGMFLRGVDSGRGADGDVSSRVAINGGNTGDNVGSYQPDAFKSHNHEGNTGEAGHHNHKHQSDGYMYENILAITPGHDVTATGFDSGGGATEPNIRHVRPLLDAPNHTHIIPTQGEVETRPKNMAVYYIIKL